MRLMAQVLALAALCLPRMGLAGAQQAAPRHFDVVSLRPAAAGESPTGLKYDPQRLSVASQTLRWLILQAYSLRDDQLKGGPAWVSEQRFSLTATTSVPATRAEMKFMLQGALTARFQLKLKETTPPGRVYALAVSSRGFHVPARIDPRIPPVPQVEGELPRVLEFHGFTYREGSRTEILLVRGQQASMTDLANYLAGRLGHAVTDQTQVPGKFDFGLVFAALDSGTADAPALPVALRNQLGLELRPGTGPNTVVTIIHAEAPAAN